MCRLVLAVEVNMNSRRKFSLMSRFRFVVLRNKLYAINSHLTFVYTGKSSLNFWVDFLKVFGTSLAVSPFNTLVARSGSGVPRVYINRTKPGAAGGLVPWIMGLGSNIDFSRKTDLILQSDCDETVRRLCTNLGWKEELDNLEVKILQA